MQTVYACGGGGSQQREVADGDDTADVIFTDTATDTTVAPTVISSPYRSEAYQRLRSCPHSLHLSLKQADQPSQNPERCLRDAKISRFGFRSPGRDRMLSK